MEKDASERESYRIGEFIENGIEDSAEALARAGIVPGLNLLTLTPKDVDTDEKIAKELAGVEVDDPYFRNIDVKSDGEAANAGIVAAAKAIASSQMVSSPEVRSSLRKYKDRVKKITTDVLWKAGGKKTAAAVSSFSLILTACGVKAEAFVPETVAEPAKPIAAQVEPPQEVIIEEEAQELQETPEERFQRMLKVSAASKIAITQEEIKEFAANLGEEGAFKYDYGSNFCGPLAADILKDVGLFAGDIQEMYLFEPGKDMWKIKNHFPVTDFIILDHLDPNEPIGEYDWTHDPLKPGDFVYLEAKSGGYDTFDHMLVVTEVDDEGRAFTVTNFTTDGGDTSVVDRILLYDPADPTAGLFYKWTQREYKNTYGNTGGGGFFIIRPKPATIKGLHLGE
ncbi:MAG TPA: hypothetical protein VJ227_03725 [Patescibacteria group bacterium]|nr:hypothetical protein [Patescibacteria group bacterium]